MRLDSVRELKAALAKTVLAPLTAPLQARTLGLPAQPVSAAATPPTLALGVVRRGDHDYRLAVRIQQRVLENGPRLDAIRRQARGEIDVRYVGPIVPQAVPWHQKKNRPLRIGGSVGHYQITAGTLGCFVRDLEDESVLILSNNHVLANENRGKKGDAVLQPGRFDGGEGPGDVAAALRRFVRLKRIGANGVDAAVAVLADGGAADFGALTGLGKLAGAGPPFLDTAAEVAKVGRTTGLTRGRATAFEMDNVVIGFGMGNLRFDNQVEIEGTEGPFSRGGDSGSLIVDSGRRAVALLFAGSDAGGGNGQGLTYANPLASVLDALNVALLY